MNLKHLIADASWKEITGWTNKETFDPRRHIVKLKFENDHESPLDKVADETSQVSLRMIDMKLHSNGDTVLDVHQQGELGNFRIILKITSGNVETLIERLALGNTQTGETEVCKEWNAFMSITDQGRLPRELLVDLLGDPIFTADGTEPGMCTANSEDWSNFINSEKVKFLNAAFNEVHADFIAKAGWRSYWKIIVKTGLYKLDPVNRV